MLFASAAALLSIATLVVAQSTVPSDLSSSFDDDVLTLQVLYPALEVVDLHGFTDGTQVSRKDASQAPTFALGDSSSISTSLEMIIMLVDTTSSSERMLHFMQTGFKATLDATEIESSDTPLVPYAAPGTLGEPSGKRQYSWLLFQQPSNFQPSTTVGAGEFDVASFSRSNNLDSALAGVGMFVNVDGLLGSGSDSPSPSQQPTATQQQQPHQSTTQQQPTTTQQQPTTEQQEPTTQSSSTVETTTVIPFQTINPAPASTASTISPPIFSFNTGGAPAATSSTSEDVSTTSSTASTTSSATTMVTSISSTSSSARPSSTTSAISQLPSSAASTLTVGGQPGLGVSFAALPIAIAFAIGLLV